MTSKSQKQSDEHSPLLHTPPSSANETSTNTTTTIDSRKDSSWQRWIDAVTPSARNKGMMLILSAEVVGASMDATARFLQQSNGSRNGRGIGVFQIIFARMSTTWVLSTLYLWWNQVPDFPFGNPKVRGLLFLRALFGFSGLFCLYYSVHYLPLSEATIIRFLVPLVTTILCSILLSQPFTRRDVIAGILALAGVVVMAHPASIFGDSQDEVVKPTINASPIDPVTPQTHLFALFASLVGVFFAAGAYTTIRLIGSQAHALISVSYFSALATTFTLAALLLQPTESISFIMPADFQEWFLLITIGVSGFVLQFLLTAGLQMDKSSRATSMLYLQVVFAGGLDWCVWGVLPGMWSLVGGGVVIGSTLWLALGKSPESKKVGKAEDEESGLLGDEGGAGEGRIREDGLSRRASVSA